MSIFVHKLSIGIADTVMEDQNIKQDLIDLYSRYWDAYINNIRTKTYSAYPFLLWPQESYVFASTRIMICGQETQGWGIELDEEDPSIISPRRIVNIYNDFVNKGGYNSPYWNFSKRISRALSGVGIVYNNINKIGKRRGAGCDESIFQLTQAHFPVFKTEVDILRPDLIIFLTGPKYDRKIEKILGSFDKKKISGDKLISKLSFEDSSLPPAIRTYHPGYLQRKRLYGSYSEAVVQVVKEITSILH